MALLGYFVGDEYGGRTLEYDAGRFFMGGLGEMSAANVLAFEHVGQISWQDPASRSWFLANFTALPSTQQLGLQGRPTAARPKQSAEARSRNRRALLLIGALSLMLAVACAVLSPRPSQIDGTWMRGNSEDGFSRLVIGGGRYTKYTGMAEPLAVWGRGEVAIQGDKATFTPDSPEPTGNEAVDLAANMFLPIETCTIVLGTDGSGRRTLYLKGGNFIGGEYWR